MDGRFKVMRKLGSGAFGDIYKVEKKKSGEVYAAKIVSSFYCNVLCGQIGKSNEKLEARDAFLGE